MNYKNPKIASVGGIFGGRNDYMNDFYFTQVDLSFPPYLHKIIPFPRMCSDYMHDFTPV